MTTVPELVNLLQKTQSPKPLLLHQPLFTAPPYMVEPVTRLSGKFHPPPYSKEEEAAIKEAKLAADLSGAQSRADTVFPNLMIGNLFAAEDAEYLASQGVTHLVNTAGLESQPDCVRPNREELARRGIQLLNLQINDRSSVAIREHFPVTGAWMKEALGQGGKVLVNCYQGASRSTTVVLAYLVQHEGLSLAEAVFRVKESRDVRPNDGFLQQLLDWQEQCRK